MDIMSDVTPGVACFAGAGEWFADGAGAFVALFTLDTADAAGGALPAGRAAAFRSAPVAVYDCPAGVIAGS